MIYSRQGTTDTIEEVEDEQDQGEDAQRPADNQEAEETQRDEVNVEDDGKELRQPDEEVGREEQEVEAAPCDSFGPDEGPSARQDDAESAASSRENNSISESEDVVGQQDFSQTEDQAVILYTPDTDASKTSDTDVPPSYSKAVSFDRLEVSNDESDDESDSYRRRRLVMTSDSRSDSRSDIMLPSMTTELTASELLLNK